MQNPKLFYIPTRDDCKILKVKLNQKTPPKKHLLQRYYLRNTQIVIVLPPRAAKKMPQPQKNITRKYFI